MASGSSVARVTLVFLSLLAVAALQSWPLPLHLATHLTGNPGGDTGVYLWNSWVFRRELLDQGDWPFTTDAVLGAGGPVDLSLHNYTVFANLMALPLQSWLGVVGAFNVVYLINVALAGLGVYLLALRVGRGAVGRADAWLAALVFACSPFLVARSTAHFSLVAAAPLPFFALCFDRAWEGRSVRWGIAAGACLAWAMYSDAYYAVYCVLLGALYVGSRTVAITRRPPDDATARRRWMPWLDVPILAVVAIVTLTMNVGDGVLRVGSLTVSIRSLYTPVLILTILSVSRALRTWPLRVTITPPALRPLAAPAAATAMVAALLTAPVLYALVVRAMDGHFVAPPVLWRSSAPGVDLASFVLPNPNHPLAPEALRTWVAEQPGRFEENVASIPWTLMAILVIAWRRSAYRPSRWWMVTMVVSISLAVGPFLRVAGMDTFIPTPWALLRYVPGLDQARMPTRFAVLVALSAAVLLAGALAALRRRSPGSSRWLPAVAGLLLAFELLPAPRRLSAVTVPPVFDVIAADPRPVSVLTLPFGIRDGLSSIGNFTAMSLVFQTHHEKRIVGGYLSRVSQARKDRYLADPVLAALALASEGKPVPGELRAAALESGPEFVERSQVGWVVIERSRSSKELQRLAIDALRLREVSRSGDFVLYVPALSAEAAPSVRQGAPDGAAEDAYGPDE